MDKKKRKRRKQQYVTYDYEKVFREQMEKLDEDEVRRQLRDGKRKHIYATKEIRAGDQLEVEIYPEFAKGQKDEITDEGKLEKRRQAQKNLNDKNSRKMCERLINENFTDGDVWATFTYAPGSVPASFREADRNMQNYIRRINYRRRKRGMKKAKYIYITERSEKGRWHQHIIMDGGLDLDTVESCWKLGKRNNVRRTQRDEDGLVGMARYITKDKAPGKGERQQDAAEKNRKQWRASRGLKKPDVRVNHYKTTQRDVNAMAEGRLKVEDHLKKWYPDGECTETQIRYNAINGKFYIYGRMRLKRKEKTRCGNRKPPGRGGGKERSKAHLKQEKEGGMEHEPEVCAAE